MSRHEDVLHDFVISIADLDFFTHDLFNFMQGANDINRPYIAISLGKDTERYQRLCQRTSCEFQIIETFDARDGDVSILRRCPFTRFNSNMTDGAIGCLLAHRAAWNHVASLTCDFALIVEDDWIPPDDDWTADFADICNAASGHDIDVLMLTRPGDTIWQDGRSSARGASIPVNTSYTLRECHPIWGAGCMALTPKGARKLLSNLGTSIAVATDVITWMSSATPKELQSSRGSIKNHKLGWNADDFDDDLRRIRSSPQFQSICIWTVEHAYRQETLSDNSLRKAQFGCTPQLGDGSLTSKEQYILRSHLGELSTHSTPFPSLYRVLNVQKSVSAKSGYKSVVFDGRKSATKKPWSVHHKKYRSRGFSTAIEAAQHFAAL